MTAEKLAIQSCDMRTKDLEVPSCNVRMYVK